MLLPGEFTKLAATLDMMPGLDGTWVGNPTSSFRQTAQNISNAFGGPVGTPSLDAMSLGLGPVAEGAAATASSAAPGLLSSLRSGAGKALHAFHFLPGIAGGLSRSVNDLNLDPEEHPFTELGQTVAEGYLPSLFKGLPAALEGLGLSGAAGSGVGKMLGSFGGPLATAATLIAPYLTRKAVDATTFLDQHPDFDPMDMSKDLKPTGFENYGPRALQHINQAASGNHLGKAMDWMGKVSPEVGKSIDAGMSGITSGMNTHGLQSHGLLGSLWNKVLPSGMNQAMQGVNQMRSTDEGTSLLNNMISKMPAAEGMNKDLMGPRMVANILGKALK